MIDIPENIDAKLQESYRQLNNSLEEIDKTAMTIKQNRDALVQIAHELIVECGEHNFNHNRMTTAAQFAAWEARIKAAQENS